MTHGNDSSHLARQMEESNWLDRDFEEQEVWEVDLWAYIIKGGVWSEGWVILDFVTWNPSLLSFDLRLVVGSKFLLVLYMQEEWGVYKSSSPFFLMNNNKFYWKKRKILVHEEYTRKQKHQRASCYTMSTKNLVLFQYRKQIKSTKFPKEKVGTWARAQSRRDLRKEDLRRSTLDSLSS
jgi:hypothetical protein